MMNNTRRPVMLKRTIQGIMLANIRNSLNLHVTKKGEVGINRSTLSSLEHGNIMQTEDKVRFLLGIYNVDPDKFFEQLDIASEYLIPIINETLQNTYSLTTYKACLQVCNENPAYVNM